MCHQWDGEYGKEGADQRDFCDEGGVAAVSQAQDGAVCGNRHGDNQGVDADDDRYSAIAAETAFGGELFRTLPKKVIVCGNATEYGVKATCDDLLETGHEVTVLEDALGYITKEGHDEAVAAMREQGVRFINAVRYD